MRVNEQTPFRMKLSAVENPGNVWVYTYRYEDSLNYYPYAKLFVYDNRKYQMVLYYQHHVVNTVLQFSYEDAYDEMKGIVQRHAKENL